MRLGRFACRRLFRSLCSLRLLCGSGCSSAGPARDEEDDEDADVYEVERILDERRQGGRTQFLIRWEGFDEAFDSWEPVGNVSTVLVAAFRKGRQPPPKPSKPPKPPELLSPEGSMASVKRKPAAHDVRALAPAMDGAPRPLVVEPGALQGQSFRRSPSGPG